jgi:hypothetical protein
MQQQKKKLREFHFSYIYTIMKIDLLFRIAPLNAFNSTTTSLSIMGWNDELNDLSLIAKFCFKLHPIFYLLQR